MSKKLSAILPCIALLSPFHLYSNEKGDNTVNQQIQYSGYNFLHNIEDSSINPVSISDIPINSLAIIKVGYAGGNGDFHPVDKSGDNSGMSVDVYGIKKFQRIAFEGGISYFNQCEESRCWNSSLYLNSLNPFKLADSDPSDYDIERFHVDGRISYNLTRRIRLGINLDYNVGVMSDEKDPRLETKGMRFIINPGISWALTSKLSAGATGGLNMMNETSRYSCVATAVNFPFYLMSGLGTFYPANGSAYTRDSKGTSWFAGADMKYQFTGSTADFISLTFNHDNENANDGGSTYQFKGGEYINDGLRFYNRLSITGPETAHNIELKAETNSVKGKWFDQKSVTENGTTHYEVMSSSIKHKESLTTAGIAYRFDRLETDGTPSLTVGASATLIMSDIKNYPELYMQKYNRLSVEANIMKRFMVKKLRLGIGIDGGYCMNLSSDCDFNGLELQQSYSLPLYAYLTSSSYSINGRVEANLPVNDLIIGLHVSGGTSQCVGGKLDTYKNKGYNSLNIGLSLAF